MLFNKLKVSMQNFLQIISSIVTLFDFFILDLNDFLALMFFYKIDFSLKNKLRAFFFRCVLRSFIS